MAPKGLCDVMRSSAVSNSRGYMIGMYSLWYAGAALVAGSVCSALNGMLVLCLHNL
jgi:hypothetical protein